MTKVLWRRNLRKHVKVGHELPQRFALLLLLRRTLAIQNQGS